uniref:non-specific serine/threonine protein kinase n=1 Tax=Anabas testudineus TaxID=64144 RepID=A0A7N6A852_ANATE
MSILDMVTEQRDLNAILRFEVFCYFRLIFVLSCVPDIWSLGVILYMLVCGVPPFQETNDSETLVMILDCRYSIPEHVSGDCRDLISRMLQKNPCRRASLEEIEDHDWLKGLDNALLSPEAPPHWLSGALSPSSPRSGMPECGDLLVARSSLQHGFTGPWQPSLSITLRPPPAEEPPLPKNLPALQQICEEEEEEEEEDEEDEEEEEEEEGSLEKEGESVASSLVAEPEKEAEEKFDEADGEEERKEDIVVILEEEVADKEEGAVEKDRDSECVISDQPVSHGDKGIHNTGAPPPSLPGLVVPCCQGQPDVTTTEEERDEEEPNNNTNKRPPSISASSARLNLNGKEAEREGEQDGKTEEGRRGDTLTDRSQTHNALGTRDEAAARAEQGKRHSIKLRERLFQFPLCEKALAFNIPTHNKPKILPLAQYNCCHVL